MHLVFDIDGVPASMEADPCATLQQVLQARENPSRDEPRCTSGTCGACTVLLNGAPALSCLTMAATCRGGHVVTSAGVNDPRLDPLRRLFDRRDINPCGACASGILVSAASLLAANPRPTPNDVRHALAGHICRCLGYSRIVDAVTASGEPCVETVYPHDALPTRARVAAALSHQQVLDRDASSQGTDSLAALRSRLSNAETLSALDRAAAAFDWPAQQHLPGQPVQQRRLPGAAVAAIEQSGITSIAFAGLEFDAETAIVNLSKVVTVVSGPHLPPGCANIAEAAVMDAVFISLRRSNGIDLDKAPLFPEDFPTMLHSFDIVSFAASSDGDGQAEPTQLRQMLCLATVCAIGSAIARARNGRLPDPPFTPDRLPAPIG